MPKPYENFDHTNYAWHPNVDYRHHPEHYRIGKGEQGVLICKPYKSEILPLWRFKTPDIARKSARLIYKKFLAYLSQGDYIGADMARKYLQMGYTRSRRYANYRGGRKYQKGIDQALPIGTGSPEKAVCAKIFYEYWQRAEAHKDYHEFKKAWKIKYG